MVKILMSIRLDEPIVSQLKSVAKELGWSFSAVIRYLLAVSVSLLHPHVRVSAVELTHFLMDNEEEDGMIPAWKIVQFISPRAVKQIEEFEKEKLR